MTSKSETVLVPSSASQPGNSKPSLLNLPTEIRVMILEHCLVRSEDINLVFKPDWGGLKGVKTRRYGLVPEVLCVCKRMFAEGTSLLYVSNIFSLGPLTIDLQWLVQSWLYEPVPRAQRLKTNFRRISKMQIAIGEMREADSYQEDLHSHFGVADLALYSRSMKTALRHWPQLNDLQWINCKVDDSNNIWTARNHVGIMTIAQKLQLCKRFEHGHPDESTLNEQERSCADYIFRLSALKVARLVQERGGGFTRFYRAIRPIEQQCIQRSVVVTKGPVESVPGFKLDNMQEIRHMGELEIDVDRCEVKEITGPRAGYCY
ncbi:hypothetical protein EPUS_01627 [Endocarpon pusillum Z07020]|uniref:F-box domain-containing protein n=1 Tax=Endocarpon pusillum (strain Z07020 / HMAS-L-300199) TaxID=1263415 RepID=U1GDW6_ENDPU|nr:uncharacterized protein EPUS_01627 [Endocarpon pusillum Z07020]ERF75797.1 hypothetical protein EPUS_01627 [Endocarpon pusillum Z07020]